MNVHNLSLARNYATAFLNVYPGTHNDYEAYQQAASFLSSHKNILLLLTIPMLDDKKKSKLLEKILAPFALPEPCNKLIQLLLQDHRIALLPDIVQQMIKLYRQRNGIQAFTIRSSNRLSDEQVEDIKNFIKTATNDTIDTTITVDPRLIAGIRLQSDTLLWEYSIAKQLRSIKQLHGS